MSTRQKSVKIGLSTLAIHGGLKAKMRPSGKGKKHTLTEWRAIKPIFARGKINMARGPEVMKLREKFCAIFGRRYAVTTSSGTAALHVALGALEIGRSDEVITSPVTDVGTLIAILQMNAVPVFADVAPQTMMITPETVAEKITRRTKAIIPVHLAGLACDVKGMKRLAGPKKIAVVEDVAQSYLCTQGKALAGTVGEIGCFSLNESKHIGAGDGGILLTNDKKLAERADLFADKCYDRTGGPRDPFFTAYNYRLSTLTAAVALEQLKKLKRICVKRTRWGTRLDFLLAKTDGIIPRPVNRGSTATYWFYMFRLDTRKIAAGVDTFAKALAAEGISARTMASNSALSWSLFRNPQLDRHACSFHCPLYKGNVDYNIRKYPGLQEALATTVRIGMNEFYTMADIKDIARAVRKVAQYYVKL